MPLTKPTILTDRFDRAILYATHVHGGQVRKGTTTPYVAHLLAVAATVLEYGGDEELAIAALLHDSVEDQGGKARLDDVRNRFGDGVARIVEACSDSLADTGKGERKAGWRERKEALSRAPANGRRGHFVSVPLRQVSHCAQHPTTDHRPKSLGTLISCSVERIGEGPPSLGVLSCGSRRPRCAMVSLSRARR